MIGLTHVPADIEVPQTMDVVCEVLQATVCNICERGHHQPLQLGAVVRQQGDGLVGYPNMP